MATPKVDGKVRRPASKISAARRAAPTQARSSAGAQTGVAKPGSVIMQARIDAGFAKALVEQDAVVLGLDGPSALVREGLRLVHERAREAAMIAAYDELYAGDRAPLPTGIVPADDDQ